MTPTIDLGGQAAGEPAYPSRATEAIRMADTPVDLDVLQVMPRPTSLSGLKVMMIGINYWPEVSGIGPYTTAMAEELVRCGSDVTVLAGVPHYPSWTVREGYRHRLRTREQHNGVDLRRLRHHVPGKQSAMRRAVYEGTFLAQTLTARPNSRPDIVLAVVPSLGAGVCGLHLARKHRVPLVVVVQDLLGQAAAQSGIAGGQRVARATGAAEAWVLRHATVVAIVSDSFRSVVDGYGVATDRVVSLPNWSHIPASSGGLRQVRRGLGWPDGVSVALHSGNMGLKQDLGNVLEAARATSAREDLLYVLMGDGSQRSALQEQARGLRNVRFLDPVPDETYLDVLRAADILLINERPSVQDMSLPSKLTSYFRAGQPVVAATAPGGATHHELRRVGAAMVVPAGDPRALADAIVSVTHNQPALATQLGLLAKAYAERHLGEDAAMARLRNIILRSLEPAPSDNRRTTTNRHLTKGSQ